MNHAQRNLLQRIHDAGIKIKIDGDRLTYTGPKGAMTPELRAAMTEWKPDLIYEYHERLGILVYDARLPEDKALEKAAVILEGGAL